MNKTIIQIFIIFAFLLLQFGCDNCNTTDEGDFKLTNEDLHLVPYNGTETLIFKNQAGDSVVFYGAGRHSDLDQRYRSCDYNTDCCDFVYYIEIERTIFAASNNSRIYFRLERERESFNNFGISIKCSDNLFLNFSESFKFNSNNIYCPTNSLIVTNDTLTIAGKEFYSVYELKGTSNSAPDLPIVYYSLTQGIVGFKTIENVEWCLSN
ncbi:MAG TPA: hypothetical protein PKN48_04625 [Bacteroidales bacterium]|nr:hypothetical protein [Bacteroidales bacterium]